MDLRQRQFEGRPVGQAIGTKSTRGHGRALMLIAVAGLIFVLDSLTPPGRAVAVLYVLVIVSVGDVAAKPTLALSSVACLILTLVSFYCFQVSAADRQTTLNLAFSLVANLAATMLMSWRAGDRALLAASEHRYRTIFETLSVAIWEHDFTKVKTELNVLRASGIGDIRSYIREHRDFVVKMRGLVRITDVNQTALRLVEIDTKSEFFTYLDEFVYENERSFKNCLIAIDEGHATFQSETVVRSRTGRLIPVLVVLSFPKHGESLGRIQGSFFDMTERLQFQEALEKSRIELEHASRAATIGEISASIAHEVNQPLAAAMTFIDAAQSWLNRGKPDLDEAKVALRQASVSTGHAAEVVERVRMLPGKSTFESRKVDLRQTLKNVLRLKQTEISDSGVSVLLHLGDVGAIRGDHVLLQQAFLNIVTNALQAMNQTDIAQRSVTITSRREGAGILVTVADTGSGIGSSPSERLFKAFESSKPGGMGLGLSICKTIFTAHNGAISIENRTDMPGALVKIRIPLLEPETGASHSVNPNSLATA